MDDVKDKMNVFMKKISNPFSSSSSGKFKGQGRVLGSSSSSSGAAAAAASAYSSASSNPVYARPADQVVNLNPSSLVNPKSLPKKPVGSPHNSSNSVDKPVATPHYLPDKKDDSNSSSRSEGFDPYGSLVTSAKRSQNGYTLNVFECPVCLSQAFKSEEEVSIHVDTCINDISVRSNNDIGVDCVSDSPVDDSESCGEIDACVGSFLSGNQGSIEVVVRLFRNIVKDPENPKFRKIRMSNPKIREAIGDVSGGVELLEFVGFELREDGGEMWAAMEVPTEERIVVINKILSLFEQQRLESSSSFTAPVAEPEVKEQVKPTKVDRQIRVFFSVSESLAAKIELPDSFYNLSYEEMKRESEMKKKKLAESQLLIPRSFKEKQAKASRKRYKRTMIRIQFPDGVVLQGVFAPWETTSVLYEFVSSALKDGSLEFELLHPVLIRRRVIPHIPAAGMKAITLDEEDLVPSALIKFKPIETDSTPFTGLSNELLQISEPLDSASSAIPPSH